jgi:hypothetical protein
MFEIAAVRLFSLGMALQTAFDTANRPDVLGPVSKALIQQMSAEGTIHGFPPAQREELEKLRQDIVDSDRERDDREARLLAATKKLFNTYAALMHEDFRLLGLTISAVKLKQIDGRIAGSDLLPSKEELADLIGRIRDEINERRFLVIEARNRPFYEPQEPLFGLEAEDKFPQMSEDISEAGKCLALARPTACVFHLMRVMERGVHAFGDKLGVPLASELNWQNILDQINKRVRTLDPKAAETKTYAEAASHLYNVKLAWRNEVMHPKQTYTADDAETIFRSVRSFVQHVAGFV